MTPTEATPALRRPGVGSRAILALLAFAMLIVSLDQYIVVVALPDIGRGLGYSAQTLQAVISAYAVASAGFLLLGGRASDLLGRRRVLVSGLALYAGGSLAGGLAPAPEVLLGARAVQGLGGALVFPATLALINTTLRPLARRQPPSLGTAAAADLLELTRADAMLGQPGGHPLIEACLRLGVVLGLAGDQGGRLAGRDPAMAPFLLLGDDLGAALGEGPQQVRVM
jgi:MFS family permease